MRPRVYEPPTIVAHRGLHTDHPENSLGAFQRAGEEGMVWVELDLRPSADGVPVVIHDHLLDRTTTGAGLVAGRRWSDLKGLSLRHDGRVAENEPLPDLRAVCSLLNGWPEVGVFVEIKPPDAGIFVRDTVWLLRQFTHDWVLQSFDEANLVHCLVECPDASVAYLVEDRQTLERAVDAGWNRIHVRHDLLDAGTARWLQERGVEIGAWTVNAPEDLHRVIELGAHWIITDEPLLAMSMSRR